MYHKLGQAITHWPLDDVVLILNYWISISYQEYISWAFPVKLPQVNVCETSLMSCQHWLRLMLSDTSMSLYGIIRTQWVNLMTTEAHKGHHCKYFFRKVFFYFRKFFFISASFFLFPQAFFLFPQGFFISTRFTYLRKVLFISARFVSFPQGYINSARFILFPQGYFYFPEVYFFSAKFTLLPQRIFSVRLINGRNHCV